MEIFILFKFIVRCDVEQAFRVEILFNNTDSSMELGVVSANDVLFQTKMLRAAADIEDRTGMVSDVQ